MARIACLLQHAQTFSATPFADQGSALEIQLGRAGRLVAIYPRRLIGSSFQSAGFVLKIGEYGSEGVTILTVSCHFELTCPLDFAILERPRPGMVRVLTEWNSKVELQHLAEDLPSAHEWLARHRYSNAFLSIAAADETGGLGALRRAA